MQKHKTKDKPVQRRENTMKKLIVEGTNIPQAVDGAVFDKIPDITDIATIRNTISNKLAGLDSLALYVTKTGCTIALVEVVSYCYRNNIPLTLYHHNDTGDYYPQVVIEHNIGNLEAEISTMLHKVGMPANLKGYRYVRHAIVMTIHDVNILSSVTEKLYPDIAEYFDTTPSRVERAIRHAIEVAWLRGNVGAEYELFGRTVESEKGKPTNSEFISMIADKIVHTT